MNIRERFEEIWPVPEGVYWMPLSRNGGVYMADPTIKGDNNRIEAQIAAEEWDARLDTFTRCQETTALYVGIIDEMIREMELINSVGTDLRAVGIAREAIGRAKQKMGMMK